MSRADLLPSNATALERALSLTTDVGHLAPAADAIRRFKVDPSDALLPYLVWEYGLEELLPYLPDARAAIRDGVRWQRLRGTPAALKIALGWIAAGEVAVEQEEPGGAHWAEFQIDPGRWIDGEEIGRIVAVAALSAPARSRLARLYHGHDIRRLKLDASQLDEALLSDYSGARWRDGVTRVSFGRRWQTESAPRAVLPQALLRLASHGRFARYEDRCLLSAMRLGCKSLPNPAIEHGHAHERRDVLGIAGLARFAPERRFARAQIVLSEQWALGATNACLPPRVWVPAEAPMRLGDALSSGIGAGRWEALLERLESWHAAQAIWSAARLVSARHPEHGRLGLADAHARIGQALRLDERGHLAWVFALARQIDLQGQRVPAPSSVGRPRRFAKSQIALSEGAILGHTDARTARGACIEIAAPLRLGELRLDDRAVVVRWPLDALDERVQAGLAVAGLDGDAHRCVVRAHARAGFAAPLQTQTTSWRTCAVWAHYRGQRWSGRWQQRSWRQARECLQSQHLTQQE